MPERTADPEPTLTTDRLTIRRLTLGDAPFMLRIMNEPSFLRYVGDRGIRTREDARKYIGESALDSYRRHGFGPYLVQRISDGRAIGVCSLLKRDGLAHADIGFAFLPDYWGRGYAFEASAALLAHARDDLELEPVIAITTLDNVRSERLLEKLGLSFERIVRLSEEEPPLKLFKPQIADGVARGASH